MLEDNERRQAADTAAVERKQAKILAWHSWRAVTAFRILGVGSSQRVQLAVGSRRDGFRLALISIQLRGISASRSELKPANQCAAMYLYRGLGIGDARLRGPIRCSRQCSRRNITVLPLINKQHNSLSH